MNISEFKLIVEEMKKYNGINTNVNRTLDDIEAEGDEKYFNRTNPANPTSKFNVILFKDVYVYKTSYSVNNAGSVNFKEERITMDESTRRLMMNEK